MINREHYRMIARAAVLNCVSYDTLAEKYEGGMPLDEVLRSNRCHTLPDSGEWCWMHEASRIMGCSYLTLVGIGTKNGYLGLDTKSASKNGKKAQGCGRLVRRSDAKEIARIKREVSVSLTTAFKILQAKKDGVL